MNAFLGLSCSMLRSSIYVFDNVRDTIGVVHEPTSVIFRIVSPRVIRSM